MFNAFKRAYKQSFTYGIASDDLTPREKKFWISMLYILIGMGAYYQLKSQVRDLEEGEFSLWQHLFSNPEDRLVEELKTMSDDDLTHDLRIAESMGDEHYMTQIAEEFERRYANASQTIGLSLEDVPDKLSDADNHTIEHLWTIWVQTNDATLTPAQLDIKRAVEAEYVKRDIVPF